MANSNNILGQEPIEKEDLSKSQTKDQGKTFDAYTKAANIPSPAYSVGLNRQTSYVTPDQPLSEFKKRVGEYIPTGGRDLQEELAQDQSGLERWAYFLPRAATKALSSAASLPGYISGFAEWAETGFSPDAFGSSFNNGWIAAVENAEEGVKKLLPVYTPQSVIDGGLWKNLGSSAFWANEGADAVGFLVGMLAPGALVKGLKAGEAMQGLWKTLKPGFQLSQKLAGTIDDWTAVALNTTFEAANEGQEAYRNALAQYNDPELAGKAGANTFKSNIAILVGPNILTQKWLFNGFNRGKSKAAESVLARSFTKTGEIREAVRPLTRLEQAAKIGKTTGLGILSEGFFEEGLQNVVSEMSQEGSNPLEDLDEVAGEYIERALGSDKESTEFWKSVVLGGLLGGGMSTFQTVRRNKAEQTLANEYHSLLKSNYINRYTTMKDFAVIKDGNPVIDPDTGEFVVDKEKLAKATKDQLNEAQTTRFMDLLKANGEEEAFEYFKNIMDARYIYPFIQTEGGLELFKKHAEFLATKEAAQDAEATGIDPGVVEQVKNDLIKKANRLQSIYDDVKDKNAITLRKSIKRNEADSDIFNEFVLETENAKISTKNTLEFILERIDILRNKLAKGSTKISSSETKANEKLISSLKEALDESKKNNNIDEQDIIVAERQIEELENYVEDYKIKSDELKDLYKTSVLQKAYDKKLEDKEKAKKLEEEENNKKQSAKATEGLSPELAKIYSDNVIHESLALTREEDLVTTDEDLRKNKIATHRGIISIPTAGGEEVFAKVGTKKSDGSLSLQIFNKIGEKYEATKNRASLNADGTITINGEKRITDFKAITTVKTAEEVREETQIQAVTTQYTNLIDITTELINKQKEKSASLQKRIIQISTNINNVITKYRDTLSEQEIELRKVRVGSKVEEVKTKRKRAAEEVVTRIIPIYKTIAEAREEINLIEASISKIEESIVVQEERLVKLNLNLQKVQNLSTTVLNSLNNTYFLLRDEIRKVKNDVSDIRTGLAGLRGTMRKLLFKLRSIHSDLIDVLGIPIDRDIPTTSKNNFKLEVNGKIYEYSRSGDKHLFKEESEEDFHTISKERYDNAYDSYYIGLEQLGLDAEGDVILKHIDKHPLALVDLITKTVTGVNKNDQFSDLLSDRKNVLEQISILNDIISTEESTLFEKNKIRDKLLNELVALRKFRSTFLSEYKKAIGDFFTLDDWLEKKLYDESLDKESVLEGKFGTLFKNTDGEIKHLFEEASLKVFDGTINSFLIPGTDQSAAVQNDQTAYWFAFVNNHAYKSSEYSIIAVSKKAAKELSFGDKLTFVDEEDIKYVAVKKGTLNPVMMDDSGKISDTGTHMAVTSMLLPKYEYTKKIDGETKSRFSFAKFMQKFATENPQATKEQIEKHIAAEKARVLKEYIALRKDIENSNVPFEFNIEYVTAGVKVTKDITEIDALEAFAVNNIAENATFVIEAVKPKATGEPIEEISKHKSSNSTFDLINGYLYIRYKNRFELIKPKTLAETGDVENILNLFKFVALHLNKTKDGKLTPEAEQAENVRKYLTTALYHNSSPASGFASQYRLFFRKDSKNGKYMGLVYGDTLISMEDLISGKADKSLSFFLSNKYWNFKKKAIEEKGKSFIEFKGRLDSKGNIKVTEKKHRNYLHFLFPNNVPAQKGVTPVSKGVVLLKPAPKDKTNHLALAKDPQYINQGLQLSKVVEKKPVEKKEIKKRSTEKIDLEKNKTLVEISFTDESGELINKYLILDKTQNKFGLIEDKYLEGFAPLGITKDDFVTADLWTASLRSILRAEDGTARITEDTTVGKYTFKFYSGEFSLAPQSVAPTTTKVDTEKKPVTWETESDTVRATYLDSAKGFVADPTDQKSVEAVAKKNYYKRREVNKDTTELERRATIYEEYEKENIEIAKAWLKKKFPNIPVEVIDGLIQNKAWGKVLISGKVLLSEVAQAGTAYHEGWHVYSQFFITASDRTALYEETRARLNNHKLSDKEVEEILAEDFRDFMMMGSTYKFNKITEVKKETIFRKILNFLKSIFGITGEEEIKTTLVEKAFKELRDNSFIDIVSKPKNSFFKIANLSSAAAQAFVEDINTRFLRYVVSDLESGDDIIMRLEESAKNIYNVIKSTYEEDVIKDENTYAEAILRNWDELVRKHSVFFTQYKADFREQLDEDDVLGRNRNDFIESASKNIKDEVPSPIRLLIGSLAETTNRNGEIVIERKEGFGTEVRVKFNKLMTAINNVAAGSSDVSDFYTNLIKLIPQYPSVKRLIRLLGNTIENGVAVPNEEMSKTQFELRNQMYHSFANNKTTPIIGIVGENGINYVYPVDENEIKVLKTDWINNAIAIAKSKSTKYIDEDFKIDKSLLFKDLSEALREKTTTKLKIVLEQLGMIVNPPYNTTSDNVYVQYGSRLKEELSRSDLGDIYINDFYNRDRIENQKELDAMLHDSTKDYINDSDLTHLTIKGNLEYGVSRGSHYHEVSDRINSYIESGEETVPKNLQHIVPLSKDGTGNLFTSHSKFYEAIQEAKRNKKAGNAYNKISVIKLLGVKSRKDDGTDLKDEEHFDYLMMTTDAILNNIIPVLRAGDRGPEYGIKFMPNEETITREMFIKALNDYLYDEVITSVALIRDADKFGGKYENYKENAKKLRVFSFLNKNIQPIEEFLAGKRGKTLDKIKEYTQSYLDTYSTEITEALNNYIDELMSNNLQELMEWKLINRVGDGKYKAQGISFETLKNLGISVSSDKTLNNSAINSLLMRHAYNYFIGSQEQLKIYLGDIAFFKNAKDFHKRITSHTSTRTKLPNDSSTIALANKYYPQAFGSHKQQINGIVWNEIIRYSSAYKKRKMSVADGQLWSTLEFARTIKIRQGLWNDNLENSYQYESQLLALTLLKEGNEDLLEAAERTREDIENMFYTGIFSEHTNQSIPDVPMFKGEKIMAKNRATITTIKPLGVGAEQNATNLFAPTIQKCSVAPLIPSILPRNSLKIYLSALANNIDVFGDSTVQKETYISSGKYGVITKESPINVTLFDDFGIQSDMNTEDKQRITKSTQMNRVLFVETHDKGQLLDKYKNTDVLSLRQEHKDIIAALTSGQIERLKKDFGLGITEDGNYYLENVDIFKESLINMVESRLMPDSVADGIVQVLDSESKSIDILITKKQVESMLMALPKKRAIAFKVNGEMYAQESSWIYSDNGEPVLDFGYDKGKPMEIMVPIPERWVEYVESIGGIDVLNKMIEEGKIDERILTFTANRIPTAAPNTLEAVRVKKFLPYHAGPRIILPYDIVIKTSSDFDIDKLFTYLNNVKITKKGLKYIEYLDDSNSTVEQRYEAYYDPELIKEDEILDRVSGIFKDLPIGSRQTMTLEEFKKLSIIQQNTQRAIENRFNEINYKMLMMPERKEILLRPHESTELKNIAEEIAKNRKKSELDKKEDNVNEDLQYLTEFWYNARKFKEFQASKSLVAYIASASSVNNKTQEFPIQINNPLLRLFFKEQEGGNYTNGHTVDTNGYPIYDNYGQFLVAAVDAVKDPYIFSLLSDNNIYSIYSFLNKTGTNKGVGLRTIAKFLNAPIIREYLRELSISNSIGYNNNTYSKKDSKGIYNSKATIISDLVKKYSSGKIKDIGKELLYNSFEKYIYSSSTDARGKAENEFNEKLEKLNYKYLSEADMDNPENAVQILDNFLIYQRAAMEEVRLQKYLRFDASAAFPKSITSMNSKLDGYFNLDSKIFNVSDIIKYNRESYLNAFLDTYYESGRMYQWSSYILSDETRRALFQKMMADVLNNPRNPSFNIRRDAKSMEKALTKVENDFYQYIYMTIKYNGDVNLQRTVYKKLLLGKDSIPNRFNALRKKGVLNPALVKILRPVINEFSNTTGKTRDNSYITTFTKRHDISEENDLTNAIEMMMNSSIEEIRKLGMGIYELGLIQNGLSDSPISYARYLPSSKYISEMDNYIIEFFNRPNVEELMLGFANQFGKVNSNDINFVPKHHKFAEKTKDGRLVISNQVEDKDGNIKMYLSRNVGARYVNVRIETPYAEYKAKTRFNRKVPVEHVLFEFVRMTDPDPKYNSPMAIYRRVNKLGDGFRFLEYYTDAVSPAEYYDTIGTFPDSPPSILTENDYINTKQKMSSVQISEDIGPNTNFNPTNVSEDTRNEDMKYVLDNIKDIKIYLGGSTEFTRQMSAALDWAKVKTNTGRYTIEHSKGKFVVDFKSGSLSGLSIDLFKLSDIRLLIGLGKLIETRGVTTVFDEIDNINAQFNEAKENYQLLNSDISEENVTELDNKMKDFLNKLNVTFEETKVLKNKFGDKTAIAISDLTNMTVKVLEGEMNIQTLPEEAAHFYVHLLDKTTGLYKSMMTNIVNHPIYGEVKEKYKDVYTTDEEFRTEAIGQVIAKQIINQYSANERLEQQAKTWWNILWNWIKNLFNKRISDPYAKVAYDILNNKIDELLVNTKEEITSDIEQVKQTNENIDEFSKEIDTLDMPSLLANFDTLFPNESWRNENEKIALLEATLYGHVEIACGI